MERDVEIRFSTIGLGSNLFRAMLAGVRREKKTSSLLLDCNNSQNPTIMSSPAR